jgi:peptidoglycan-N-acetylglucosamine deacetylase
VLDLPNLIICVSLFVSLFFEVFLLITFLENRSTIKEEVARQPKYFPTVTVVVPCFNEEKSILATIDSLLALDYPQDRLKIMVIDDGSTDSSWNVIKNLQGKSSQIEIYHKENGGKHTALNFAISVSDSEIIGCLDADSFVDSLALRKIVTYFEDKKVMAVVPSIKVLNPSNILTKIQNVQYEWGTFLRKTLSFIDSIYVTPGPFSFFRKEVFTIVGPYRHAHFTEDMEMAVRMQKHHLKIANCHEAHIYTIAPQKFKALYKQQLRWTYGTLKNLVDYRGLFFNRTQGNLGFLVLPVIFFTSFSSLFAVGFFIFKIAEKMNRMFSYWQSINFDWHLNNLWHFNLSWFFIDINFTTIIFTFILAIILFILITGRKLAGGDGRFSIDFIYFFVIYPLISPIWLSKAIYNIFTKKGIVWR